MYKLIMGGSLVIGSITLLIVTVMGILQIEFHNPLSELVFIIFNVILVFYSLIYF